MFFGVLHLLLDIFITVTYWWGFFQCFGALPNPEWCMNSTGDAVTVQAWVTTISFFIMIIVSIVSLYGIWQFTGSDAARRSVGSSVIQGAQPLVAAGQKSSGGMRFSTRVAAQKGGKLR